MFPQTTVLIATLLLLTSCSPAKVCCRVTQPAPAETPAGSGLKTTSLEYLINYGPDSYEVIANFDVLFVTGKQSTNGCTAFIRGRYGEPVKSDELVLKGREQWVKAGPFNRSVTSTQKYYLSGIIHSPDTEEIREQNKRALSIHVEESYVVKYAPKRPQ